MFLELISQPAGDSARHKVNKLSVASQLASAQMKRKVTLCVTNLNSENNLPVTGVVIREKVTTGAFSRNVSKLFSELKLVTDNLLFIYAEAN